MTNDEMFTMLMYLAGLIMTLVIAWMGLRSNKPIITAISGLFGFVIVVAMMSSAVTQPFWWLSIIPLVELMMFGIGMRS